MPGPYSRREMLALTGGVALAASLPDPARTAERIPELDLWGPPAGPSMVLAHGIRAGLFEGIAEEVSYTPWRNPDELRAGLTSGSVLLSVVPVQAAANLYNRGFPLRLANTMTDGLLYVLSTDPDLKTLADLRGRKIAVPFRGDTPELILSQLLKHAGLAAPEDLEIVYTGMPTEAMQMLLSGRVDVALSAEPGVSGAMIVGQTMGRPLYRAIDIQAQWGAMTGGSRALPQAGLAVTGTFMDAHGSVLPALTSAIAKAAAETVAEPATAAAHATDMLGLPTPLLAASVPWSNLIARPAREARADIERMLTAMVDGDLNRIGGKLPDDGFYL